ncbi:MAG: NAD(+) synthase [Desulfovibrionaceae bacterium]
MTQFPWENTEKNKEIVEYLIESIYSFFTKIGYTKCTIGISGGIDSAFTLTLATKALGKENIYPLFLPSPYTSLQSRKNVSALLKILSVSVDNIDIENLVQNTLSTYTQNIESTILPLAQENVQSRIRALLLMMHSNNNNTLVLCTSNKSEKAMGFFTLYGDSCGALSPLGDIYKTHVYALVEQYNLMYPTQSIPPSVLSHPPSAELRYGQKDSDTLPPYTLLDPILYLLEQDLSAKKIEELGYPSDIIKEIICTKEKFLFKQNALPPSLSVEMFSNTL